MGFAWDAASRVFLAAGLLFILGAGLMVLLAPAAAIYPVAVGVTFVLAAAAMAYEGPPKR